MGLVGKIQPHAPHLKYPDSKIDIIIYCITTYNTYAEDIK